MSMNLLLYLLASGENEQRFDNLRLSTVFVHLADVYNTRMYHKKSKVVDVLAYNIIDLGIARLSIG